MAQEIIAGHVCAVFLGGCSQLRVHAQRTKAGSHPGLIDQAHDLLYITSVRAVGTVVIPTRGHVTSGGAVFDSHLWLWISHNDPDPECFLGADRQILSGGV